MEASLAQAQHATNKKRSDGYSLLYKICATLLAVALFLVSLVFFYAYGLASNLQNVQRIESAFPDAENRVEDSDDDSETILLLGSDTRATLETDSASRSDTIIVVRIPASRDKIYVMSIMRDSWVDIDGYGEAKINAAFAYGGTSLAVQTVEELIGTQIDHVAAIDFESFRDLTEALGGVTVENQVAFTQNGYTFEEGTVELETGAQALAFVRSRMSFADGDYQRVRNQQAFLVGVFQKLVSRETLLNPFRLQNTISAITPYLALDEDFTVSYMLSLASSMTSLSSSDIETFTLPTTGTGTSADGQSIVVIDETKLEALRQAFQDDTLDEYLAEYGE